MVDYYTKAIEILKHNEEPTLESVMNSKFPATEFGFAKIKSAQKAIESAKRDVYNSAVKTHPRWHIAVRQGRSSSECLKLWIEEGGNSYLQDL